MYIEEQRYFDMIKPEEIKIRYYNLTLSSKNIWHKYPESIKTIGQKISYSKKGKSTGPCSPEKAASISAAKKGKPLTEEHKKSLRGKNKPHTDEWKLENSKRMKEQWSSNSKRKESVSKASKKRWEEFRKTKQNINII